MIVREDIHFERGNKNPLHTLDIGLISQIKKITSADLELLKLYTDGYGKSPDRNGKIHTNEELFHEMYDDVPEEYEEYSKRVRQVYKLLEPYNYFFGDSFETDMKDEIKNYVKSYLKNPKYNYAYDSGMGDEEVEVFFCEIQLPGSNEIWVKR